MDKPLDISIIRQRQRKLAFKLMVVLASCLALFWVLSWALESNVNRSDIRTAIVSKADFTTSISAGGIVVPIKELTISSHLDSHIIDVLVQAGQSVVKGQRLMSLDTQKLSSTVITTLEKKALKENQITTKQLNLTEQNNGLYARIELLEIDLQSSRSRLTRMNKLASFQGVSEQKLAEAGLDVKRVIIEIRQIKQKTTDSKAATLAIINGLKLELEMLNKSHALTLALIERANVKAPRSGLIVWLNNEAGSSVNNGQALVKIADTSSYKLQATISDFYSNQLWQGMDVAFNVDDVDFTGQLTSIIASDTPGVLTLNISLDSQKQHTLRQQQRVEVSLITGQVSDALIIAKGPFVKGSGSQQVFVINNDSVQRFDIKIGAANRDYYQISQGLHEGDEVIISSVELFKHKTNLTISH
ncbi:MAG: efflux RND transporter periplasmic adaptor subunit [Psychrobium sp.]|nr:efflux RND transporter periplasmic adaptor subunit [Psychrobium sp.]